MSESYTGQILTTGFDYAVQGFSLCNGSLLPLQQNVALYSLIGTIYGGDGKTTFALPDMRGRTWLGEGTSSTGTTYQMVPGAVVAGGAETVTLTTSTMPMHTHNLCVSSQPGNTNVKEHLFAAVASMSGGTTQPLYAAASGDLVALGNPVTSVGGGGAHDNLQPFLVLNFMICTAGYYPSRP